MSKLGNMSATSINVCGVSSRGVGASGNQLVRSVSL